MKLLVTGRTGQVVRSLVERAAGHRSLEIISIGRPEVNLERPGALADAIRAVEPDVVINAAALTAVDQAEGEAERAFRVNAEAAGEAAVVARAIGAPIIQISTDYVFDGQSFEPYRENSLANPLGVYGRSKLAGESVVRCAHADHLILRTGWVYSPFGRNFVKAIMEKADEGSPLTVVDDQWGSPTSALELADALLRIVNHWSEGARTGMGQTVHLAGAGRTSWHGLAVAILAERHRLGLPSVELQPITSSKWPAAATRPRNSALDSGLFVRLFGFGLPEWQISLAPVVDRLAKSR